MALAADGALLGVEQVISSPGFKLPQASSHLRSKVFYTDVTKLYTKLYKVQDLGPPPFFFQRSSHAVNRCAARWLRFARSSLAE